MREEIYSGCTVIIATCSVLKASDPSDPFETPHCVGRHVWLGGEIVSRPIDERPCGAQLLGCQHSATVRQNGGFPQQGLIQFRFLITPVSPLPFLVGPPRSGDGAWARR